MSADSCQHLQHLSGQEAVDYARDHLRLIFRDDAKWTALYQCPVNPFRFWIEWYPYPEAHGGGPPELTQVSRNYAAYQFHGANLYFLSD